MVRVGVALVVVVGAFLLGRLSAGPGAAASDAAVEPAELDGPCALVRVIDGDTLDVRCGERAERIRLLNVDTPERNQGPAWRRAADALRVQVEGRPLQLAYARPGEPSRGHYGRLLAYVYVDGRNVNLELVRLGVSPWYRKFGDGRFPEAFAAAEREARASAASGD